MSSKDTPSIPIWIVDFDLRTKVKDSTDDPSYHFSLNERLWDPRLITLTVPHPFLLFLLENIESYDCLKDKMFILEQSQKENYDIHYPMTERNVLNKTN